MSSAYAPTGGALMLLVTRRSDVMERSSLSGRGFHGVLAALVGYSCDGVMHYYCGLGDVVFLLRKFVCE
jgi:ABC-type uncharacterized transport system permease subunit